jgi:hypothetical protein
LVLVVLALHLLHCMVVVEVIQSSIISHQQVVGEEVLEHLQMSTQLQVGQAVVDLEILLALVLALLVTLRQLHHHKEILVAIILIAHLDMVLAEVVVLVHRGHLLHQDFLELVVLELHPQFLVHR